MKNEIMTERLILRPFMENDLEAFFACCQNPDLGNNAGWKPHETIEESKDILQQFFIAQENVWAIARLEDQRLIGSIGIIPDSKRENPNALMLGYWLDEAQWDKGYMTEAVKAVLNFGFETLNIDLITANCYPHNERSQKVLKKQGFEYEGTLHQAELMHDGQIHDHQCYYLKKKIWEQYNKDKNNKK